MKMKELIKQITNIDLNSKFATDEYIDGFNDAISAIIKKLKTISINEEDIVRCKDCRYYSMMYKLCGCRTDKYNIYLNDDDFCSFGEREKN